MNIGEQNRSFSDEQRSERRTSPRSGVSVPVESFAPGSDTPLRGATSDLSETGCYVETIFPFPIGTILEMSLQIDGTLLALGTVVTCDTAARVACRFEVKSLVKSIQAYCRFAIAIIATMQAPSG